jgi:probable HAF family extracellular repeat protein
MSKALRLFLISGGLSLSGLIFATTYSVVDLTSIGVSAGEITNNDEVVGTYTDVYGDSHACVWSQSGGVQVLQTIPGDLSANGYAGNASGEVVGSVTGSSGTANACVWSKNGSAINIGSLISASDAYAGGTSAAVAVNSSGQVAGYYLNKQGTYSTFLYSTSTGTFQYFTNIGNPLYPDFQATSINDYGQIAGGSYDGPCIVSGGSMQMLGTYHGGANAINNSGQATGFFFDDPNNYTHAFVWTGSAMEDIGTSLPANENPYADANSSAAGINNLGQVVGSFDYDGIWASHGFIWTQGGGMVDLNTMLGTSDAAKYTVNSASGINDGGWILASVNGSGDSAVLVPASTPEPCTLAALGGGLFALLIRRRRRQ